MYVVGTSVYVPLIMLLRSRLRKVMVEYEFHLLDLTLYESCNVFWKECVKLHRIDLETARQSCRLAVALARYATLHQLAELDPGEVIDIAVKEKHNGARCVVHSSSQAAGRTASQQRPRPAESCAEAWRQGLQSRGVPGDHKGAG
ncbi:hypothetical protein [Hyperthermus butylicus]|uniref:Uncharacterized protein n=1 Tax=Hyperthermus butylicus (strain DSM 5456 / JCM 9403 / PLM1-5) TaxID=415426 RepID=A2BKP3_HYPBU|nr:hypothetical protein [Hyperthermus butylicus]ABM80554.1 hypothetical protein Hbut_0699 [Hyperthermus butylicus DSM 5456]